MYAGIPPSPSIYYCLYFGPTTSVNYECVCVCVCVCVCLVCVCVCLVCVVERVTCRRSEADDRDVQDRVKAIIRNEYNKLGPVT